MRIIGLRLPSGFWASRRQRSIVQSTTDASHRVASHRYRKKQESFVQPTATVCWNVGMTKGDYATVACLIVPLRMMDRCYILTFDFCKQGRCAIDLHSVHFSTVASQSQTADNTRPTPLSCCSLRSRNREFMRRCCPSVHLSVCLFVCRLKHIHKVSE